VLSGSAAAEDRPDYFEPLRAPAYLQHDTTYVAREKGARPDAPPAFKARHLTIRLRNGADEDAEWWPKRNLLLVEMADGARFALESTFAPEPRRTGDPRPFSRVSFAEGGTVETWMIQDPDPEQALGRRGNEPPRWDNPCGGGWMVLHGGGLTARLELPSTFTRTMRAAVGDLRDAALRPDDVARLETVFRIEIPRNAASNDPYAPRTAAGLLLVDRPRRNEGARYVLTPSPEPPGDLAPWRALTEIPTSLPPYVFIPRPRD